MFHPLWMHGFGLAGDNAHRSETAFEYHRYAIAYTTTEGKGNKTGMGKRSY